MTATAPAMASLASTPNAPMPRHSGAQPRKIDPPLILLPPNPSPSAWVAKIILRWITRR